MEHRSIRYEVREIEPNQWVWIILPADASSFRSSGFYRTRELAIEACIGEINNGLERSRRPYRKA
jgi:hypothetical protein